MFYAIKNSLRHNTKIGITLVSLCLPFVTMQASILDEERVYAIQIEERPCTIAEMKKYRSFLIKQGLENLKDPQTFLVEFLKEKSLALLAIKSGNLNLLPEQASVIEQIKDPELILNMQEKFLSINLFYGLLNSIAPRLPKDFLEYYTKQIAETQQLYEIRNIILPINEEASSQQAIILQKLEEGVPFEEVAKQFSVGSNKEAGGFIAAATLDQLPSIYQSTLFKSAIGSLHYVDQPGYKHIIKLVNKSTPVKIEKKYKIYQKNFFVPQQLDKKSLLHNLLEDQKEKFNDASSVDKILTIEGWQDLGYIKESMLNASYKDSIVQGSPNKAYGPFFGNKYACLVMYTEVVEEDTYLDTLRNLAQIQAQQTAALYLSSTYIRNIISSVDIKWLKDKQEILLALQD